MTNRTPKVFTVAIIATLALSAIAGTFSTTVQAEQSNEISQKISDNAASKEHGNAEQHDTQVNVFSDRANDVGDSDNGGFDDARNDHGNHYGNEGVDDDYSDTGNNGGAEDNGSGNDD